ncbi:MAG: 16S rRNA (uracil(1498)-N(3))-methyltransferase [Acidimicrobiia bacterium]|nr:16S rRNA (uracil(1498)-N(3))-methyltransferase [Acidimicrobiia bacterium]
MTPAEHRSRPLVFVADLERPRLDEADHHHLRRVLRCRVGDPITVADGAGRWRSAALGSDLEPDAVGPIVQASERRRTTSLTVGFALVKGDRSELAVQKLTELGIDRIIPLTTERTVVRWDGAKAARNRERHRRVARQAAMQSRNLWLPDVWPVTALSTVVERLPDATLAEPGQTVLGAAAGAEIHPTTVLVGPEGGFSPQECAGRPLVGLPGNILRTETAAICAAVLLVLTAERG